MRTFHLKIILLLLLITVISTVWAQNPTSKDNKVVIVTGARFSYSLVQQWIDEYNKIEPSAQIIIESRGSADPATYDILVESYDQEESIRKTRDYAYVARYPIFPVANSRSAFSKFYVEKGLNRQLISQLFFHDLYSEKEKEQTIKYPYTVYNRLQKAGAPIVFANYFGYAQKDIRGKAIAGADEHLLKALLRDSSGVSYLPLTLIFDHTSGKPVTGLSILPVDIDNNGKVSDDEKFYSSLSAVVNRLDNGNQKELENIPVGYLHLSVPKSTARPDVIAFVRWVVANGQKELPALGYLKPLSDKTSADLFVSVHPN